MDEISVFKNNRLSFLTNFHFKSNVERSRKKLSFLVRVKLKQKSNPAPSFSWLFSQETSKDQGCWIFLSNENQYV